MIKIINETQGGSIQVKGKPCTQDRYSRELNFLYKRGYANVWLDTNSRMSNPATYKVNDYVTAVFDQGDFLNPNNTRHGFGGYLRFQLSSKIITPAVREYLEDNYNVIVKCYCWTKYVGGVPIGGTGEKLYDKALRKYVVTDKGSITNPGKDNRYTAQELQKAVDKYNGGNLDDSILRAALCECMKTADVSGNPSDTDFDGAVDYIIGLM